jgi:hypothetical protein
MMKFPSEWKVNPNSMVPFLIIISHYIPLKTLLYPIKKPCSKPPTSTTPHGSDDGWKQYLQWNQCPFPRVDPNTHAC